MPPPITLPACLYLPPASLPPARVPPRSLWQRVRQKFEPSVPSTTLVNDGSVFVALGVWAGWTAAASDPTLPLGAALAFAAWKLYDKRNKRNPGAARRLCGLMPPVAGRGLSLRAPAAWWGRACAGRGVLRRGWACRGAALEAGRRCFPAAAVHPTDRTRTCTCTCTCTCTFAPTCTQPTAAAALPQTVPTGAATRCGARWVPWCWRWCSAACSPTL